MKYHIKSYAEYLKYVLYKQAEDPFFIVGTGRSGTHFMDSIMNSHPEITDLMEGQENPFVFGAVTDTAIKGKRLTPLTLFKYRLLSRAAGPKFLVDQSHPNLWHIDQLIQKFPRSKFIAMVRCPFSVTYSTLQHSGVSGWLKNYDQYPVPNDFLGITTSNRKPYGAFSLATRSALRWCSHMQKVDTWKRKYPDAVYVMNYESLCGDPAVKLAELKSFLGLQTDFPTPKVNYESVSKMEKLSDQDKVDIATAVERFFVESPLIDEEFVPVSRYLSRITLPDGSSSQAS